MGKIRTSNPSDRHLEELMPILVGLGPNGDMHFYGSCFVISPRLVLTARHVIRDFVKLYGVRRDGLVRHMQLLAVQTTWEGREFNYVVWNVVAFSMSRTSDLAILTLEPHSDSAVTYEWKPLTCTLQPPAVGELIHAFGIVEPTGVGSKVNDDNGKFEHLDIDYKRLTAKARVIKHHPQGRDSGFLSFPCFEVDVCFEHCMSGGAVVNERGEACGIVCSGNDWGDEKGYVALLFPMMAIPVDFTAFSGLPFKPGNLPLIELARCGIFTPNWWHRVLIEGNTLTAEHRVSLEIP